MSKEIKEVWVNIYEALPKEVDMYGEFLCCFHPSKEEADHCAGLDRIARIKLPVTPGQFDD